MTHTPHLAIVGEHTHVAVSPEIPLGWRLPETRAHVWLADSGNYVVDGMNSIVRDAQPGPDVVVPEPGMTAVLGVLFLVAGLTGWWRRRP